MNNKITDQAEKLRQLAAKEHDDSVDSDGSIATLESPASDEDRQPIDDKKDEIKPKKRLLLNPNKTDKETIEKNKTPDSTPVTLSKEEISTLEQKSNEPLSVNKEEIIKQPEATKEHKAKSIETVIEEATGFNGEIDNRTNKKTQTKEEQVEKNKPPALETEKLKKAKQKQVEAISILQQKRFPVETQTRVIAVTGGKGGVGKSNVTCNLALAMVQMNKKVLILDADLSLANIDVLLGLTPRLNLAHVLRGEKSLKEIVIQGPGGLQIIPSGSGLEELTNLTPEQMERLFDAFSKLEPMPDILLIDTAAGIHPNVLQFLLAADQTIVVTTPEPTAYTDAYALIKTLAKHDPTRDISVIINMAQDRREALDVTKLMFQMCRQFLKISFNNLGYIPRDNEVATAVRRQKALLMHAPNCPAAKQLRYIASTLLQIEHKEKKGLRGFFAKLFTHTDSKKEVI